MEVKLINHTLDPEGSICSAAAICYRATPNEKILEHCLKSRHFSVLEFADFDFLIEGISRACSHQLVRKRIGASYAQESQRHVKYDDDYTIVVPHTILNNSNILKTFMNAHEQIYGTYATLLENGVPAEDARYIMENAATTRLRVKMNARCLIDLASERLCTKSQWEIRELVEKMRLEVSKVAPTIAKYMQPRCFWLKRCPEHKGCGKWKTFLTQEDLKWIEEAYKILTENRK